MTDKQKLDGRAFSPAHVMAMMELLNGGPEPGRLDPEDRIKIIMPKGKNIGRVFITSTVEDMDKSSGKEIWDQWNK